MAKFTPIGQPEPASKSETAGKDTDAVEQAENERKIAEENLKKRTAEEGLQSLDQLKTERAKLGTDRESFEKQKSAWIADFEKHKVEDIEKVKKVKAYWEAKAVPIKEMENNLSARSNRLDDREESIKIREQSLETRLANLDGTVELKQEQIHELQNIIDSKAPHYHKLFKQMVSVGERRANWNYNIARGDQWHNFTERVRIIFESLHRMLFGD